MLKAGALYFSIVIAFFIAIISASLIMLAAHYRNSYLKDIRYQRLTNNIESGVAYILATEGISAEPETIDLYGEGTDSLFLEMKPWGIYPLAVIKTFILQDTLKRAMLLGQQPDQTVLYLSDENRPLSVSGQTKITGDALLPKSGIRQSYAEGKPYAGSELVYGGKITNSSATLSPLAENVLKSIHTYLDTATWKKKGFSQPASLTVSFLDPTRYIRLPFITNLSDIQLKGNVILYADSIVQISSTAQLDGVQIYAPIIKVASGFKGRCQLFARDSVIVGEQTVFNYPSVIGVLRTKGSIDQPKIQFGQQSAFNGVVFSYEKTRTPMQTMISLNKGCTLKGEIYSTGFIKVGKEVKITGKTSCNTFVMQTSATLYENFLIDITLNRKELSNYYLSSPLFNQSKKQVLQWLE
ncbi:hypothetical protein [Pedobacter montanisoli]|uniref:Uncharacterized protein n=1 Tax=Pedobacter montanisoli TaxID=2923277 RepID=A0ABS9ZZE3_9SPHI|nr:hypothetical protein [Pedobacter montanisoli]MCJ0743685.1 hypothetical protein [Pedobacter montanisoli]